MEIYSEIFHSDTLVSHRLLQILMQVMLFSEIIPTLDIRSEFLDCLADVSKL